MTGSPERSYAMSAWDARTKLVGARFDRGALADYPGHDVHVYEIDRGKLEWQVVTPQRDGFWCPIVMRSSGGGKDPAKVMVSLDCPAKATAKARAALQAATDDLLAGRTPDFER